MNDATDIDWTSDYLRTMSARVREVELEREGVNEALKQLKSEATRAGVRWDAFMLAHRLRVKLSEEERLHWHGTFASAAEQLALFVEDA